MTTVLFCGLSLFVGILIGVVLRDALDLVTSGKGQLMKPETRNQIGVKTLAVLMIMALLANAMTAVFLLTTREASAKYAECVATWQQAWAKGYRARYASATRVSNAMDRIVKSVADQDKKEFRRAVAHYQLLRAAQNQARLEHPLPQLPSRVCGPPGRAAR